MNDQDGRRAAGASLADDCTSIAAIIQQNFAAPRHFVASASLKEKRAFIQRIPEDGSGSALTPFLRNLNIHIR
jgi:hypothetical protein